MRGSGVGKYPGPFTPERNSGGTRGTERYPGAHSREVCAQSALPSKTWRRTVFLFSGGKREGTRLALPQAGWSFLWRRLRTPSAGCRQPQKLSSYQKIIKASAGKLLSSLASRI